jgi:REP element-mobilizing transposase RayT
MYCLGNMGFYKEGIMNDKLVYKEYHKRRLPHLQPKGSSIFVTFRLNFSLPQHILDSLASYQANVESELRRRTDLSGEEKKIIVSKKAFANYDMMLNQYNNFPINLCKTELAETLVSSLKEYDGSLYRLHSYVVMPNHVHILFQIAENELGVMYSLAYVMKAIKGASARFLNLKLNRKGRLWLREYYDHCIRNEQEFHNVLRYMEMNPVKAGLVTDPKDWPWTWKAPRLQED